MKKIPWFLLAGVVLVGGWFWFKRHHDSERESDAAEKSVAKVETTLLRRESIARTLEAFGVAAASPSSEQAITAMFDCVVRRVQAAPGAAVAAGDVLLEIDPNPDTRLALESARSMAKSAAAALASAQERSTLKLATSQDLLAAQQADQEARLKLASFETRGLAGRRPRSVAGGWGREQARGCYGRIRAGRHRAGHGHRRRPAGSQTGR